MATLPDPIRRKISDQSMSVTEKHRRQTQALTLLRCEPCGVNFDTRGEKTQHERTCHTGKS